MTILYKNSNESKIQTRWTSQKKYILCSDGVYGISNQQNSRTNVCWNVQTIVHLLFSCSSSVRAVILVNYVQTIAVCMLSPLAR